MLPTEDRRRQRPRRFSEVTGKWNELYIVGTPESVLRLPTGPMGSHREVPQ